MNEFYLNSTPGKNLTPPRVEPQGSPKKNSGATSPTKASFKEVLKGVAAGNPSATEIRKDIVEKYKTSLAEGTYEVKAEELAEKMIQKIRDNKKRAII